MNRVNRVNLLIQAKVVLFVLFLGFFSWAAAPAEEVLLKKPLRPTVSEFLEAYGGALPAQNPYELVDYNRLGKSLLDEYKERLPSMIAQFEKAFPGGTYVGLGRDSALLTDALDAFYLSRGQQGRAIHFNASTSTFQSVSVETFIEYTRQLGFDFKNFKEQPPFIFFDGTHYNGSSQSNKIMRMLYSAAIGQGATPADLVYKLNFISTSFNGYAYYPRNLIQQTDVSQFLKTQSVMATSNGPVEILSVDGWYLTHGYNWTNTFSTITKDAHGIYRPAASALDAAEQKSVLGNIYFVIEMVRSQEFFERVKAEAKKMGYDFEEVLKLRANAKEYKFEPIPQEKPKSLKEKLGDLQFAKVEGERDYNRQNGLKLSENGHRLWAVLAGQAPAGFSSAEVSEVISLLIKLETEDKIGERDFIRILFAIMPSGEISDSDLALMRAHRSESTHLYKKMAEKLEDMEKDFAALSPDQLALARKNKEHLSAILPMLSCRGTLQ